MSSAYPKNSAIRKGNFLILTDSAGCSAQVPIDDKLMSRIVEMENAGDARERSAAADLRKAIG